MNAPDDMTPAEADLTDDGLYGTPPESDQGSEKTPRRPGWAAVLGLSVLAAGIGAVGGYALSHYSPDTAALRPLPDQLSMVQNRLSELEAADPTNELRAEVERLASELQDVRRNALSSSDMAALNARLDALDSEPTERSEVAADNAVTLTPRLARRLTDLEDRLTRVELQMRTPDVSTTEPPATAEPTTFTARALPPFPYEAVEAALDNTARQSLIGRFVKVRDADTQATLEALRNALDNNNLTAALDAYDRLPDTAQDAARNWAEAARETP